MKRFCSNCKKQTEFEKYTVVWRCMKCLMVYTDMWFEMGHNQLMTSETDG